METWIERETLYRGRIITLETGRVRLDDGTIVQREVMRHPGAVAVAPFIEERVVLVRQYRVAIEQETLEIPAGKIERSEDPVSRGLQELREETGLIASKLIPAGAIYPSAGILDEKMYLYLAFDLVRAEQRLDHDERIEVVELTLHEVRRKLRAHEFVDAKTIVGLHALLTYIDEQNSSEE